MLCNAALSSALPLSLPALYVVRTYTFWPFPLVARFTSALEQFNMPQQTGVPCSRTRDSEGGACFGHTCERDYRFSWFCLNSSVNRQGVHPRAPASRVQSRRIPPCGIPLYLTA